MPCLRRLAVLVAVGVTLVTLDAQTPQPSPTPPPPATPPAAAGQPPDFRVGVDVLPVDVVVVDRDGRQVLDLTAADFVVEVDGRPRTVLSAEYVKLVDPLLAGQRRDAPDNRVIVAPDSGISSNDASGGPPGRAIVLLIDQGNIRFGAVRPIVQNALKFIDRLQPHDRLAVVAVPAPGELVDFTTDHAKVREAMLRISGQQTPARRRFNISLTEAFAVYRQSDALLIAQVLSRECSVVFGAADLERCERDVEQEAAEIVGDQRQQTDRSIGAIRAVLRSLGGLDGPKSVVLISEGLVLETLGGELDDLARIAADVRASLDVLLLEVPAFDVAQSQRPTTSREDRDLQEMGLQMLAGLARGTLHRIVASGEFAFRRIEMALAGHYLLGVEPTATDRDGRRHAISVKTTRRGVTVQSRRTFLSPDGPPAATPVEAVSRALRSPAPATGLPVRMSTWTYKEPGTSRVRVLVAAEVERGPVESLDFAAGLVVATKDGKVIAGNTEPRTLKTLSGDEGLAVYASSVTVDPGEYRVRLGVANADRQVGSVERAVTAWQMSGDALALGDLLVAPAPDGAELSLAPSVEPRVHDGTLVALAEAYLPAGVADTEVAARLDILQDESSRALVSSPLDVGVGGSPEVRVAQGRVAVGAIPPGRYLARVSFTENGAARGALSRPFRVLAPRGDAAALIAARPGAGAPAELLTAVMGSLPAVSKDDVLDASTTAALWAAAEQGRTPPVLAAIKTARDGQMMDGALAALSAGDQGAAAFVRGMDLLGKAQVAQAATQFETAMRIQGGFAAARAMLGACLLLSDREKEAAGLLMSLPPSTVPALGRLAGEAWLRAGQPAAAIGPLEQASQAHGDARSTRALALAYALVGDGEKGLPALATYLSGPGAKDGPALAAGVYATYRRHLSATDASTIGADRVQARTWARAYAATKGPLVPLVQAWAGFLDGAQ